MSLAEAELVLNGHACGLVEGRVREEWEVPLILSQ